MPLNYCKKQVTIPLTMGLSFVALYLVSSFLLSAGGKAQTQPHGVSALVDAEGRASDVVVQLLGLTGIRIAGDSTPPTADWPQAVLTLPSRSVQDVNAALQGKVKTDVSWLRPTQRERWELGGLGYLTLSPQATEQILALTLGTMDLGAIRWPKTPHYEGVLLLGSTMSDMHKRLSFLLSAEKKNGGPLGPLCLLTGERSLDPKANETYEQLQKLFPGRKLSITAQEFPSSERDIAALLCHELGIPGDRYSLVYGAKRPGTPRATTVETLYAWWDDTKPRPGRYLLVSAQPFVLYQALVFDRILRQHAGERAKLFTIETIGEGSTVGGPGSRLENNAKGASFMLDDIARIFYELAQAEAFKQ